MKHGYKSEAELCEVFMDHARSLGWRVFPETSDHDILLVATSDVKTFGAQQGDQIAVQAKLRTSVDVIFQAMPKSWTSKGPHYHAVLVPHASSEFSTVARHCGVVVIEGTRRVWKSGQWGLEPSATGQLSFLPLSLRHYYDHMEWHPDVEILVPAGVPSPTRITPWKIGAVRLCIDALRKGFITTADFRSAGISVARWRQKKWIAPTNERIGRSTKYVLVPENRPPHILWPEIFEKLSEDSALEDGGEKKFRRHRKAS